MIESSLFRNEPLLKTHPDPASKSARVLVDIDLAAVVARGAMALRIAADRSAMVVLFFVEVIGDGRCFEFQFS